MPILTTESELLPGSGPYLARVVNNLDPDFMGGLEVLLFEGTTGDSNTQDSTVTVKYLPSFWGTTSIAYEGNNSADFNDVQKSYGMWAVPPDVGTIVMCFFVGGDRNSGYWMGVVPDRYQNHMVPSLAASKQVAMTPEQERKYGTKYLPVGEYSKKNRTPQGQGPSQIASFNKPVHPFADRLLSQGLLLDDIRGVTSSSARREHPSGVFGISTPGPVDTSPNAKQGKIGYKTKVNAYVSRLGGHQLVMDDGDPRGLNELFRIRTRTGHQILLHNSSDLIYIANAAGTAWIELTAQGKIDIYAADSVSIHAENDFNLRADRDFNIEAGRDFNIGVGGNLKTQVAGNYSVDGSRDAQFAFDGTFNLKTSTIAIGATNTLDFSVGGDARVVTGSFGISTSAFNLKGTSLTFEGSGTVGIKAADLKMSATATAGLKGDTSLTLSSAGVLNLNGPPAPTAPSALATAISIPPVEPSPLPLYELPNRQLEEGWSDGKFYKAENIVSIMKRVPTHEPWDQHENINPTQFTAANTDLEVDNRGKGLPGKNPNVSYSRAPAVGTPPTPSGNVEEDNVAAFLWMIRNCEGTARADGYQMHFGPKGCDTFNIIDAVFPEGDPTLACAGKTQYYKKPNPSYQYANHPCLGPNKISPWTYPTKAGSITSSAAGAYQFLSKTWADCAKALSLTDFSPRSQDLGCIFLLKQARALDDIKKGNFTAAISKTKRIWASLPGDVYGQGGKTLPQALAFYKQGGGTAVA